MSDKDQQELQKRKNVIIHSATKSVNKKAKKKVKKKPSKKKTKIVMSKELVIAIMTIFFALVVVIGTTYAVFTTFLTGKQSNSIIAGVFEITFSKEGEMISLNNSYPMSDERGLETSPYTFTISNTGTLDAAYRIRLEEDTENPSKMLTHDQVKISYKKGSGSYSKPQLLSELSNELIFVSNERLSAKQETSYEIKMWADENVGNDAQGKSYRAKIVVEAVQANNIQYEDTIPPVITLKGNRTVEVVKGSSYTEEGIEKIVDDVDRSFDTTAAAKSIEYYNGQTTTTVDRINTNNVGVYYVYYRVNDSHGNEGIAVRTINVYEKDTTPPTLTLDGNENMEIYQGDEYTEPGYTATDDQDGTITDRVVVIGSVAPGKLGSTIIKYVAIDNEGNITSKTRTITKYNYTNPNCFTFEEGTTTITNYLCGTHILNNYDAIATPNTPEQSPAKKIITDVVIPKTIKGTAVTKIGFCSFGCGWGGQTGLTSVVIPEGVTVIGADSFINNSSLTKVTFPSTLQEIGSEAFLSTHLSSISLPEGLTKIGDNNFWGSSFTNIVIPSSVMELGSEAFRVPLTSVTIKGKRSTEDFNEYGDTYTGPFVWAEGSNCETHYNNNKAKTDFGDNTNPCIRWGGK